MSCKLYKGAENTYVVADDIFLQRGEMINGSAPTWISSEPLDEEDLRDLVSGEIDLSDFDLDADLARDFEEFVEVPREQWAALTLI